MMQVFVQPGFLHPKAGVSGARPAATREFNEREQGVHLPATNVVATEEGWRLYVAAPGFSKEAFQLKIEGNVLQLSAAYSKPEEDHRKVLRREFGTGDLRRSFQLPENVDTAGIQARYEAGVLVIDLPKRSPLKVEIG